MTNHFGAVGLASVPVRLAVHAADGIVLLGAEAALVLFARASTVTCLYL